MKKILFDQRCERSKAASFRSDRVCLSSFYLVKGIIGRVAFLPFIVRSDRKTIAVVTDDNTNAAFPLLKHHETNTADQQNPVRTLQNSLFSFRPGLFIQLLSGKKHYRSSYFSAVYRFPLLKHHETNTADQPNPVQTLKSSPSFRSDRVCLSSFYLVKGIIGRVAFLPFIVRSDRKVYQPKQLSFVEVLI